MRLYLLLLFALSLPVIANAEFCNWGFVGPKTYRCSGENYLYGTAACRSGIYSNVFCHEKFSNSGRDCQADNSPATMDCYNRMVAPGQTPQESGDGFCNWGFAGPQVITCNGQRFVYGTAACRSGIYSNIFCKEELSASGSACADDGSSITIQCYNRFIKSRPPESHRDRGSGGPSTGVQY